MGWFVVPGTATIPAGPLKMWFKIFLVSSVLFFSSIFYSLVSSIVEISRSKLRTNF